MIIENFQLLELISTVLYLVLDLFVIHDVIYAGGLLFAGLFIIYVANYVGTSIGERSSS